MTSRFRPWIVALFAAVVCFGVPFATITAMEDPAPEIRLVSSRSAFSALIVTNETRILVVNTDDRRMARSIVGRLSRPWEPDFTMVIAPSRNDIVPSLWEVSSHPAVRQVVISGLGSSHADWTSLERELSNRGVDLIFLGSPSVIQAGDLTIEVHPGDSAAHLLIKHDQTVTLIALDNEIPSTRSHAAVSPVTPGDASVADVWVLPPSSVPNGDYSAVVAGRDKRLTLRLVHDEIRIQGGQHLLLGEPAN